MSATHIATASVCLLLAALVEYLYLHLSNKDAPSNSINSTNSTQRHMAWPLATWPLESWLPQTWSLATMQAAVLSAVRPLFEHTFVHVSPKLGELGSAASTHAQTVLSASASWLGAAAEVAQHMYDSLPEAARMQLATALAISVPTLIFGTIATTCYLCYREVTGRFTQFLLKHCRVAVSFNSSDKARLSSPSLPH